MSDAKNADEPQPNNETSSIGDDRPHLHLIPGPKITFESLIEMFEQLTGRPPTEEERAEALREWENTDAENSTD